MSHFSLIQILLSLLTAFKLLSTATAESIPVNPPPLPSTFNVVQQNFLGISLELSFMDEYFGNDTSTIPSSMMAYLSAIRSRTGTQPLRLRVGGNSMDSSIYKPEQVPPAPMVQLVGTNANANNQPVTYGPGLWEVMKKVADDLGGAEYFIGLSLLDPNSTNVPLLAGAAQQVLGSTLDSFVLGNEPDLYANHGERPNQSNYTLDNYIDEFRLVSGHLTSTSAGNLLDLKNIGGPTICCNWNLDAVLQGGYLASFSNILKYIILQHYPQNNCGSYKYSIPYYQQHANVVELASWQEAGIKIVNENKSPNRLKLAMSEFNSASCGGIPGISDTFVVGSMWTADYALQMASVGYSAAYLHTRERGISYNLVAPPDGPDGNAGPWTTGPPYYALILVAEALKSNNGSIVIDLDVRNSTSDKAATVGGYAVHDANDRSIQQLVLFNYGNTSSAAMEFAIPTTAFPSDSKQSNVTVKYLTAASEHEKTNISWGGETLADVGNGKLRQTSDTWAKANDVLDCAKGCSVTVPAPGIAVVFVAGVPNITTVPNSTTTSGIPKAGNSSKRSVRSPLIFLIISIILLAYI